MHIYQGFYNTSPFQQLLSANPGTRHRTVIGSRPIIQTSRCSHIAHSKMPGNGPSPAPLITPNRQQLETSASSHRLGNFLSSLSRRELELDTAPPAELSPSFFFRRFAGARQRILASDIVDPNSRPWGFESVRREAIFTFDPHSLFDLSFARTIILGYRCGSSTADRRRDWPSKPGFWPSNDVDIV